MTGHSLAARAAAGLVAAVAGVISYGHIRDVALTEGESALAAALMPVGVDGLIVVATLAMLEDKRAGRRPRLSARVALVFGVAATIAGNIASAHPSAVARVVAAVPAVSFLLAVEVLVRTGRQRAEPPARIATQRPTAPDAHPDAPAPRKRTRPAVKRPSARSLAAERPDIGVIELMNTAGVTERHARRTLASVNGHAGR